jgi:hypothetical protein
MLTTWPTSVSRSGSFDVSQTYGPLRPLTGIALPYFACSPLKANWLLYVAFILSFKISAVRLHSIFIGFLGFPEETMIIICLHRVMQLLYVKEAHCNICSSRGAGYEGHDLVKCDRSHDVPEGRTCLLTATCLFVCSSFYYILKAEVTSTRLLDAPSQKIIFLNTQYILWI